MYRNETEYARDQVTRLIHRTPRYVGDEITIKLVRYDNGIVKVGDRPMNGPAGRHTAEEIQEIAKAYLAKLADAFFEHVEGVL